MGFGGVETPFRLHLGTIGEVRPAGNDLAEAVRYALDEIRIFSDHGVLSAGGPATPLQGRVLLVALCPGTVLVVGASSVAHAVRELFDPTDGFTGWHLASLPTTRTPLHHLKDHLPTRQYNVLARRYGFATVEEVAAVPDDVWPEMASVGPSLLDALTEALTTVSAEPQSQDEHYPSATPAPAEQQHGWRLQVSADGTRATVQAPHSVAVTSVSGTTVQLAATTSTGQLSETADNSPERELVWNADIAEQILRRAQPSGTTFLRALIDEGGTATAERLRESTGLSLHHATQTLTTSAAAILPRHHPEGRSWRRFVAARTHPNQPRGRVYDYQLPEHLLTVFSEALQRLDR